MSKCNPAEPINFQKSIYWEGEVQVPVITARVDGISDPVGYFRQGDDGQWWWFATGDEFGTIQPMAFSGLEQVRAALCHLNASGEIPYVL